ncbi:hypothetical protein GCM10009780_48050 [Actinomadura alba]
MLVTNEFVHAGRRDRYPVFVVFDLARNADLHVDPPKRVLVIPFSVLFPVGTCHMQHVRPSGDLLTGCKTIGVFAQVVAVVPVVPAAPWWAGFARHAAVRQPPAADQFGSHSSAMATVSCSSSRPAWLMQRSTSGSMSVRA